MARGRPTRIAIALVITTVAVATTAELAGALKKITNDIDVGPGSAGGAGLFCGQKGELVSGGFTMPVLPGPSGPRLFPYATPFLVSAANFGDQVGTVTAIGYCSKDGPKLKKEKKKTNVPPGDTGSVTAKCPKGKRVMMGGFEAPEPLPGAAPPEFGIYPFTSKRTGTRHWKVSGFADIQGADPEEQFLRALAFCYSRGPSLSVKSKQTTVADGDTGAVQAKCAQGKESVAGGFKSKADGAGAATSYARPFVSKKTGKRGWKVEAFGEGRGNSPLKAYAYCAPAGAL